MTGFTALALAARAAAAVLIATGAAGLIVAGERIAFAAWLAIVAGVLAWTWTSHLAFDIDTRREP